MTDDNAGFEAALERFLQSEPEPQDGELLAGVMRKGGDAAGLMRDMLVLDDLLRQEGQPDADAFVDALALRIKDGKDDAFVRRIERAARPARHRVLWYVTAAAAIIAIAACLIWQWLPGGSNTGVVSLPKAGEQQPVLPLIAPMPSSETMVQIETQRQDYQLPSGVAVSVAGPATLQFVDDMFVNLQRGKVSADAGRTTKGFTVQTAQARVVDLGTRFGVQANDAQTEVVVFEGTVRVESRLTATMITLRAGEAMQVGAHGDMIRLTGLMTSERWQDWGLQAASVIATVATTGKNDAFCRIVPKGFKAGAISYAGAPLRWEASGDVRFPQGLTGADLVQAPQRGVRDEDWQMRVKLARPATLYVFNSKSAPPPQWLAASFTVTGLQVAATELVSPAKGKPERVQMKAVFDVWKRVVREPGTMVILGPPAQQKDGKAAAMYGVAAQLLH